MSASVQSGLNGRFKKSLAYQLDRLDSILDGLADALNGAVADAVKQAVGEAAREAVKVAMAEVQPQQPAKQEHPAQRLLAQAKAKATSAFSGMKRLITGAFQKIKVCCTKYTGATVLAGQAALAKARSRTIRVGMLIGAVSSCVMGLFRKESRKLWWGAGIVLSTMVLESYFGTLGTLLLGGGVIYVATQSHNAPPQPTVAVSQAA